MIKDLDLAKEEYASKGMRWVKASELPKKVGGYWCKVERTVFKREVFFNGQRFDGEVIEWLDESTQEGGTVEFKEHILETWRVAQAQMVKGTKKNPVQFFNAEDYYNKIFKK